MNTHRLLELCKRIKAISQIGLLYSSDDYNKERYRELELISHELLQNLTGQPLETIADFYLSNKEYPTPKTDIRAVIFNDSHEILLVLEKDENRWSLPGGWADIGYTPREIAVKEVQEETGLQVAPVKLLAILDKKCHPHPPEATYIYKYFIQCRVTGGALSQAHDIHECRYFAHDDIPPLSEKRVLATQLDMMFEYLHDPHKEPVFD